ncbi:uncharacterized protein LOC135431546 [Drosophila montana]|uniref:uncharacterized protein LOC135431546 n=1 Tax=Drosophila montana TaxID=40370 RepID=UPI00313B05DE
MKYLAVILTLLLCVLGSQGDCQIARHMVENTKRIFTYRDASGALRLLRTERVPSGMRLYMYCSASDVLETQCQDNGQFTLALPMSCGTPMRSTVVKSRDAACPQTLYIVGYSLEGKQLELFRCCHDAQEGRVLYAESDVYYKSFFAKRPWVEFETDQIVTPQEAAAFMKRNTHDAFNCIFGDNQKYLPSPSDLVINRGHLVASADFLFCDQMGSTFRYLNVVPQFKSINDGNWEKIERWLRSQVPAATPFRIRTGGIDVLTLQDQHGDERSAYLSGSKLPVPLWIYKTVRDIDGNGIYVFLSYNNIFERNRPEVLHNCQTVACPVSLPDNANDGFIFCCNPNNFPY